MSFAFERLLVNVLFLLLPIFIYQIFLLDKDKVRSDFKNPLFAILMSLSIILCMSYPIEFFPGFMFDLRQVPFIIGALYGGYRFGAWLLITILGYRLLIGGDDVYVNFLVVTLVAIIVPILSKTYMKLNLDKKIVFSISIAVTTALLTIFLSHYISDMPFAYSSISLNYFMIQGLSMWLLVYLMETMKNNHQMRKELAKAEKMSVISQLSASISHELKNPITITQGFVEALEDENSQERRKEYVGYALDELQRAQNIIYEFLALTKPDLNTMNIINISQELAYVVNLMKPYAKANSVKIKMEPLAEDCKIVGDHQKIRQCFINIVKNSIEAMENGGELHLRSTVNSNKVYIDIIDNGVGMTPKEISQLGTPYYSTKEQGTGLGMMIVFNVIKKMKGDIKIQSQKGKGTQFTIMFPLSS
ncbi:sensor histidine kinase [Bacillus dakarensis]|uniref:sensor histidine kinase n=1 Tax=Robertmurraya dakarensis TaxID=1926278 RepID=UPI000980ADE5|nr:HAMP domain-containing sensor histidine kinase [Bacillus dakarensis]